MLQGGAVSGGAVLFWEDLVLPCHLCPPFTVPPPPGPGLALGCFPCSLLLLSPVALCASSCPVVSSRLVGAACPALTPLESPTETRFQGDLMLVV